MLKEFKDFVLRGNVVDLAVAVVMGAAFNTVIQSFVKDFITPIITGVLKNGALSGNLVIAHKVTLNWGDFLTVLISFILEAIIIFLFIVKPINHLIKMSDRKRGIDQEKPTKDCPKCLSPIPAKATVCAFCTSKVA